MLVTLVSLKKKNYSNLNNLKYFVVDCLREESHPSHFNFEDSSNFYSAALAMQGEMNSNESWTHPKGSSLVAWVRWEKSSPIAYIQLGDGPSAYMDSNFRKLLNNAIDWVSSEEAKTSSSAKSKSN